MITEEGNVRFYVHPYFDSDRPHCVVFAKYKEDQKCSFVGNVFNVKSREELLRFADKCYMILEDEIEFVD